MIKTPPFAFRLLAASGIFLFFSGCFKDKITRTYTIVRPIYESKTEVLSHITSSSVQPIDSIGRLYIKDQFIYLNEPNKGIHIIDNSDPARPHQTAFLNIPGNLELAIKGNTLYADMYRDLLTIDITDPRQIKVLNWTHNVFIDRFYSSGGYVTMNYQSDIDSNMILIGYTKKDTTIDTKDPASIPWGGGLVYNSPNASYSSGSGGSQGAGLAGSMAKMVLFGNRLYTISSSHSVGVVNITNASSPTLGIMSYAGVDLETIYPFKDKLFLGSKEGVFILDLSNPDKPVNLGTFSHGRACDPVIAEDNYAYVTLQAGTSCGGNSNELDVLDIKDIQQPVLLGSYAMTRPEGLSKDGNLLFVCDGLTGVKVFDATNPGSLQSLTQLQTGNQEASDVIAIDQHLFVTTKLGLYQYSYSDVHDIRFVSLLSHNGL